MSDAPGERCPFCKRPFEGVPPHRRISVCPRCLRPSVWVGGLLTPGSEPSRPVGVMAILAAGFVLSVLLPLPPFRLPGIGRLSPNWRYLTPLALLVALLATDGILSIRSRFSRGRWGRFFEGHEAVFGGVCELVMVSVFLGFLVYFFMP